MEFGVERLTKGVITLDNPSTQVTGSENHEKGPGGFYPSGGPFYMSRRKLEKLHQVHVDLPVGPGESYRYDGPMFPGDYGLWYKDFTDSLYGLRSLDTSDLDPIGARAIARCSPVNPVDTLGQGLTETIKERLPAIPGIRTWQRRTNIAKAAGDEFLNVVFGWLPLVGEVKDFGSTVKESRELLNEYHRNRGKNVRRRFKFPISETVKEDVIAENTFTHLGSGISGGGSSLNWETVNDGKVIRTVTERIEQWFSGTFTYNVPSQTDSWRKMVGYGTDADKLFGIALTPELLWNIAPWSWAIDWFSSAGDVITNISNFAGAGQVMRFGYVMEHRSVTVNYTMDKPTFYIDGKPLPVPSVSFVSESKVRRPANPYGFGLISNELSPLQIAIAAALGITLL